MSINLYSWHKTNIDKFAPEELEIINRFIPKNCARKVVIINIKDGQIKTFHQYPKQAEYYIMILIW